MVIHGINLNCDSNYGKTDQHSPDLSSVAYVGYSNGTEDGALINPISPCKMLTSGNNYCTYVRQILEPFYLAFWSASFLNLCNQWRIQNFPEGRRQLLRVPNLLSDQIERNNFGWEEGACVPCVPLDPSMVVILTFDMFCIPEVVWSPAKLDAQDALLQIKSVENFVAQIHSVSEK